MTTGNSNDNEFDDSSIVGDPDWVQVAQRRYDPGGDQELATEIVFAVAAAENVPPADVESPLYERVDAAALEATLFSSTGDGDDFRESMTTTFRYATYLVKVRSDGRIQVYEPTGDEA